VTRQLIGVARVDYLDTVAAALRLMGSEAALVVAGEESLDELSVAGPSRVVHVGRCGDGDERVTPEDAGLTRHALEALRGGDAAFNAAALRALLAGAPGAYRDAVLLNAAGALIVAGRAADWRDGARQASQAIDKGAAADLLARWIAR
jgi:anthranilate phosphoribosyltransferase